MLICFEQSHFIAMVVKYFSCSLRAVGATLNLQLLGRALRVDTKTYSKVMRGREEEIMKRGEEGKQ